jgi:hypothetical protein
LAKCKQKEEVQEKLDEVVKYGNGEILHENKQLFERLTEYLKSLLNVENDKRANLTSVGRGGATSTKLLDQLEIERHEVANVVNKL